LKRKPTAIVITVAVNVIAATASSNLSTLIESSSFEQSLRECSV
jgi:hypothetical protein